MEGLSEEIERKQPPLEHWRRFVYCTTLAGRVLGTVDHLQPEGMLLAILIFLCFFLYQFWVDCHKSMPSKLPYDTLSLSFAKALLLANWVGWWPLGRGIQQSSVYSMFDFDLHCAYFWLIFLLPGWGPECEDFVSSKWVNVGWEQYYLLGHVQMYLQEEVQLLLPIFLSTIFYHYYLKGPKGSATD